MQTLEQQREYARTGLIASLAAYFLWGVLPLYLKLIGFADPREVLGLRILWTIPFALTAVLLIAGWRKGWGELREALRPKLLALLALSAGCIFINWWIYVWAVAHHHVIEASLAYFLAPLVQVAIGVAFFSERLSRGQVAALALATFGVVIQGFALGAVPWAALAICASWCCYSVVRKQAPISAAPGLLIETVWLIVPALLLLNAVNLEAGLTFNTSAQHFWLLALSGPATAVPLILFTLGARRLPFAIIGLLQYIAPSMQFLLGVAFGEVFTPLRAVSFALIWGGLAIFTWDVWRRDRIARTAALQSAA